MAAKLLRQHAERRRVQKYRERPFIAEPAARAGIDRRDNGLLFGRQVIYRQGWQPARGLFGRSPGSGARF